MRFMSISPVQRKINGGFKEKWNSTAKPQQKQDPASSTGSTSKIQGKFFPPAPLASPCSKPCCSGPEYIESLLQGLPASTSPPLPYTYLFNFAPMPVVCVPQQIMLSWRAKTP